MIDFAVDSELCVRCGECSADCPTGIIVLNKSPEGFPTITDETRCIRCQHCLAICPTAAVSILGLDPADSRELRNAYPAPEALDTLIRGRRSFRRYKPYGVDPALIDELLETAWHAPTGVNAQQLLFTVTDTPEATHELRTEIYTRLQELMESTNPDDDSFSQSYLRSALKVGLKHNFDIILRSAPHVLAVSSSSKSATPREDAVIAMSTFDLMAQARGVGTVWNGMLHWCLTDFFPDIARRLGIPEDHTIGYCMSFGTPAYRYYRTVQRTPANVNRVKGL